jgi:hypothetical protein
LNETVFFELVLLCLIRLVRYRGVVDAEFQVKVIASAAPANKVQTDNVFVGFVWAKPAQVGKCH